MLRFVRTLASLDETARLSIKTFHLAIYVNDTSSLPLFYTVFGRSMARMEDVLVSLVRFGRLREVLATWLVRGSVPTQCEDILRGCFPRLEALGVLKLSLCMRRYVQISATTQSGPDQILLCF